MNSVTSCVICFDFVTRLVFEPPSVSRLMCPMCRACCLYALAVVDCMWYHSYSATMREQTAVSTGTAACIIGIIVAPPRQADSARSIAAAGWLQQPSLPGLWRLGLCSSVMIVSGQAFDLTNGVGLGYS